MSLKEYTRKRDFTKTSEPGGMRAAGKKTLRRFVIQKHAASHLHYDFRLESEGVLKSWAVPKGIPFAVGEKRLAMEVEDHPVSYIDFEGTIPKGEYGGGTVMLWDFGTYELTGSGNDLAKGKLHFELHGQKLHGAWYLVRMRGGKQWLLIRSHEPMRPVSRKLDDTSALSGRTMEEISEGSRVWHSNRRATPEKAPRQSRPTKARKAASFGEPKFVEPMKAKLIEELPEGGWIYEVKLDGFRCIALKNGNQVRLLSRNKKDFGQKFPEVIEAISRLPANEAIIDGEIVALDSKGRSDFQLLQAYELGTERPPLFLYAFDLLELDGENLIQEALTVRKSKLAELLKRDNGVIRFSASLEGSAPQLLTQARKLGLEGLIAKRKDSPYQPGRRSGSWAKLKLRLEQEMVIGGYTDPAGSRRHFGAVLVGYHQGASLKFAGKVGTGFNDASLKTLFGQFHRMEQAKCPFDNVPEPSGGRFGSGLTRAEMKRCHWVRPKLVAQIEFAEWTRDGKLRQPVFHGLREDKAATEVVREKAG